jgi:flagellar hook assembly protein FlgD
LYAREVRSLLAAVAVASTAAALLVPAAAPGASSTPVRFDMLAFHWAGSGTVRYRAHRLHGGWTTWVAADHDRADIDWTGAADAFQVRPAGDVRRLRAYPVRSGVRRGSPRTLSQAGSPAIVSRKAWFANEEIVRAAPRYAPALKLAIVHHTAGSNDYTRAQAAAIVRGIELYHVEANGWNDIGYNFLVDRFGTIYEGRGGGIERNVIGAHALGFNSGTVGVALIGNFEHAVPPKAMRDALVRLLAWRLDVAHVDPASTVVYTSSGNWKFRAGRLVTLRAISGHRDTGPTECPGSGAYALLPSLTRQVTATGLPKLYGPVAAGTLGGPIRFLARLSSALPWTVTIADQTGATVATGSGRGTVVDWTWAAPAAGAYRWTISAAGARPASGTFGKPGPMQPLTLSSPVGAPAVVTPNADGTVSPATLSFTLGAPALVVAQAFDANGNAAATIVNGRLPAGGSMLTWDPGHALADGRYRIVVTATAGTKTVTGSTGLVVDHTIAGLAVSPPVFSPNHDGVDDTTAVSFVLAQPVPVRLDIVSNGVVVATPLQGVLPAGPNTITWDGTGFGSPLFDGAYEAVVTVTDALGDVPVSVPVTIDSSGTSG